MRSGFVTTVRLSPADCMAVADIVRCAGMLMPGMSLSAAVGLAMEIAFEELMKRGDIPRRSGFEFNELMEPFSGKRNSRAKRCAADSIYNRQVSGNRASLGGATPTPSKDDEFLQGQLTLAATMDEPDRSAIMAQAYKLVGRKPPGENKFE